MSRTWLIRLWTGWFLLLAYLIYRGPRAEASETMFKLREVSVTYRSFFPGGTDPMITQNPSQPNRALGNELDLTVNADILKYLYWNSTVHSMTDRQADAPTDPGQFRMVGLEMAVGVDFARLWKAIPLSAGYYHYSRHVLDTEYGLGHYPVEDAAEVKLKLYGGDGK